MTSKLYPTDIFIYNRIKYFVEQKEGFCYETNKSLSEAIGRSIPRISTSVNKLIREGYIVNEGTKWSRKLKNTNKKMKCNIYKNDMTLYKNDKTLISEMLIDIYKNDMTLFTKTIRDFNKSDNIIRDNKRIKLIDISNRSSKEKIYKKEKTKLAQNFTLEEKTIKTLEKEEYGIEQINKTLLSFKDYWIEGTGKDKKKVNWQIAFKIWIRKSKPWINNNNREVL